MTSVAGEQPLLVVRDLSVAFPADHGTVQAVSGVSFELAAGRCLALVGESGSGKSATVLAVAGLLGGSGAEVGGEVTIGGASFVGVADRELRPLRGPLVGAVFQDPGSALHPYLSIGDQVAEAYRAHHRVPRSVARRRAVEMLDQVGIPHAARRAGDAPHRLSGGMRQRVLIAMALVCRPRLLVADEPTTALDVTVQADILDLLDRLRHETGVAVLLVTHDLGVVARAADEVAVMYGGRVVESGPAHEVLVRPRMPYTWALLDALPRVDELGNPAGMVPIAGSAPSARDVPGGCAFHPRCPYVADVAALAGHDRCARELPELGDALGDSGHAVRCHLSAQQRVDLRLDHSRLPWATR